MILMMIITYRLLSSLLYAEGKDRRDWHYWLYSTYRQSSSKGHKRNCIRKRLQEDVRKFSFIDSDR